MSSSLKGASHIEAGIVALLKLVDQPWFRGIWIVQEVSRTKRMTTMRNYLLSEKTSIEPSDIVSMFGLGR